ncbi:MAG: hypothetical protein AABY22_19840 [Nanoarchaeota archaeon]
MIKRKTSFARALKFGLASLIAILPNYSSGNINNEIHGDQNNFTYNVWNNALRSIPQTTLNRLQQERPSQIPITPEIKSPETEKVGSADKYKSSDEIEKILKKVKYTAGPTKFAGDITTNSLVRVIEQEDKLVREATGIASFYTTETDKTTATGVPFKDEDPTIAVNERLGYRLPCRVKITNLENGLSMEVIATDHGPYKFDKNGNAIKRDGKYIPNETRIVDASSYVAEKLGYKNKGLARVKVEYLGEAK